MTAAKTQLFGARAAALNILARIDEIEAATGQLPHVDKAEPFALLDEQVPSWQVFTAGQSLLQSAYALQAMFSTTKVHLLNTMSGVYDTDALYTVTQLGVADLIVELEGDKPGSGVAVEKLAAKLGTTWIKLDPILGQLSNSYIFRQCAPGVYTNNRHSLGLTKSVQPNPTPYIESIGTDVMETACSGTLAVLRDSEASKSLGPKDNAFAKTHGGVGFFEYLFGDKSPQEFKTRNFLGPSWLVTITLNGPKEDIPWGTFGDCHVVDVGCGDGERMLKIAPANPNIKKITFQDTDPNMLTNTKKDFETKWPAGVPKPVFEFVDVDFLKPQPEHPVAAPGPLIFWMRAVLCDYSDADIVTIMKGIAKSLKEYQSHPGGAFMIIHELFIPSQGPQVSDDPSTLPQIDIKADDVELPFPGWPKTTHYTERQVTALLSGAQRSMRQFVPLLAEAGLKVIEAYQHRTMVSTIKAGLM